MRGSLAVILLQVRCGVALLHQSLQPRLFSLALDTNGSRVLPGARTAGAGRAMRELFDADTGACEPSASIVGIPTMRVIAGDCGCPRDAMEAAAAPTFVPIGGGQKRALDIAVATIAAIALAPLMLACAVIILVTMGRPVFFRQRRLGANGRFFSCYKFRSMVTNADERLRAHLEDDPRAAAEWHARRKLACDPRITCIGRVIRKTSIDELPQLWNVLRGDMSCVGPRPIVLEEIKRYGIHAADYLQARPGLTGLWQVSGRNNLDYADRVALDVEYVNNWSIWLDLRLLLLTIPALLNFDQAS